MTRHPQAPRADARAALPFALLALVTTLASPPAQAQNIDARRFFRDMPESQDIRPDSPCPRGARSSASGKNVSLELNVGYATYQLYNPGSDRYDDVRLRSYNGCPTGPVVTVQPGGKLKVDLRNNLPATEPTFDCPPDDGGAHEPHCFNTVNLHTHGLHVSPSGKSDNVLMSISPGQRFQYEYDLPRNHPAGTFWYHAHRHGSTAIQVSSGGAGVLIVRGERRVQDKARNDGIADIDTLFKEPLTSRPLKEQTLLFQQIEYGCFDSPTAGAPVADPTTFEWTCANGQVGEVRNYDAQLRFQFDPRPDRAGQFNSSWDISGRYTQINGVVQPMLPKRGDRIAAGDVQRWRLVHGGVRDSINLKLVKVDLRALLAANTAADDASVDRAAERAVDRLRLAKTRLARTTELAAVCKGEVVSQLEFAVDGTTRTAFVDKQVNTLHPGQRSDVLVAFPSAGLYCVLDEAADAASTINFRPGSGKAKDRRLLAFARVGGGAGVADVAPDGYGHGKYWQHVRNRLVAGNPDLPWSVKQDLIALRTPEYAPIKDLKCPAGGCYQRTDEFTIGPPFGPRGPSFGINNQPYVSGRMDFTPVLGRTDDWVIRGGASHIFHVHVNAFQIVDIQREILDPPVFIPGVPQRVVGVTSIFDMATGKCKPEFQSPDGSPGGEDVTQYCDQLGVVRDTVFQKSGYRVVMRTRYEDFTGQFVMHCHILDHEDEGMMMNIKIVSPVSALLNRVTEPVQASAARVGNVLERAGVLSARRKAPVLPDGQICTTPPPTPAGAFPTVATPWLNLRAGL